MSLGKSSRRSFLAKTGLALGAAALGQLLPEGILWPPGKRGLRLPEAYASSGLLLFPPVVTVVKTVNYLQSLILSELYANKGIVNAAENERFVFEAQGGFFNAQTGGFIGGTGSQEFGVQPDTDAELRKGSTVKVVPLTLTIPATTATPVETVLSGGSSVTYQVTTSLVLIDGAGGRHYLDSVITTGIIMPTVSLVLTITPTWGPPGTSFRITDPQGRMANATTIMFALLGEDPSEGTAAVSPNFGADGMTATAFVPDTLQDGIHSVTVHRGDPRTNPQLFEGLPFNVIAPL